MTAPREASKGIREGFVRKHCSHDYNTAEFFFVITIALFIAIWWMNLYMTSVNGFDNPWEATLLLNSSATLGRSAVDGQQIKSDSRWKNDWQT